MEVVLVVVMMVLVVEEVLVMMVDKILVDDLIKLDLAVLDQNWIITGGVTMKVSS